MILVVSEWLRAIPEFQLESGYNLGIPDIVFGAGGFLLPSLPLRWGHSGPMCFYPTTGPGAAVTI
jgi:hypothetical protein